MLTKRLFRTVGVIAVVLIGIAAVTAGQGARPAVTGAPDELLAEVRALRTELSQAAGASIRAQLIVARLQLQEQRVNVVTRELADVQSRLAAAQQGLVAMRDRLAATEQGQANLAPEDRSDDQIRALNLQLEQGQNREQELRAKEFALSSEVTTEQSRWMDFNNRLDALERSLSEGASR